MYDMIVAILLMFYYFNFQKIVYNKHMIRKWRLDTLTLGVYRRQVVLSDYQTDLLKFRDYLRSNPDARYE